MVLTTHKRWALYLLYSFLPFASMAQGIITVENFETYTAGARLCTQAPAYWYTWNNGAGTAEDPLVTDELAFGGNNSLLVSGANDVLLDLNGKTSGRYEISFNVQMPSGKTGFYGLLQQFDGSNSNWGLQCYFDATNQGKIKAAGEEVDFSFSHNQWIPVRNIIDLNSDHAEVYIRDVLVYEWQWSIGLTGTPGPVKLDALNLFAWNASQRQPLMYVDSIVYKELPVPGAPLNLVASVTGNDVGLSWDAPADGAPLGYKIYRDNEVLVSEVTSLNYVDTDVYPGTYSYMVKAIYSSGLSQPAGPVEIVVEGGTKRKYVLLEIATGTWCTYCPGSAMGADDLVENGQKVAVIEYHNSDEYANTDSDRRNLFYNVPGYPTAQFDGTNTISGGNMTQSMYPQYLPEYDKRIRKLALFELDMEVAQNGTDELQVSIRARKIYPYPNNSLNLRLALTENHIPETWQVIMKEVNSVCREMYPDYNGTLADFTNDSVLNFNYTIMVDSSYEFNNCELVAFLQDDASKEVLQVDNVKFISLGRPEPQEVSAFVSPNPGSGLFCLSLNSKGLAVYIMEIRNSNGTCVYGPSTLEINGLYKQYFDLSHLSAGLYTLVVRSDSQQIVRKIVITK